MTIAELRKQAAAHVAEIRKQNAAYNARKAAGTDLWPDGTQAAWESVNKQYDECRTQIEALEANSAMEARMAELAAWEARSSHSGTRPGLDDNFPGSQDSYGDRGFLDGDHVRQFEQLERDRRNAVRVFLLQGDTGSRVTQQMRESCERLGYHGGRAIQFQLHDTEQFRALQELRMIHRRGLPNEVRRDRMQELRALSTTQATAGQTLVPMTFLETFELAQLATSDLFALCETIRTETGEKMQWPTVDDTANEGTLVTEVQNIDNNPTDPVLGSFTLDAWDYSSGIVKFSRKLARDSIVNVDSLLATLLGLRMGRIKLKHATIGTGSSQPQGVVVGAALGRTTAVATAISYVDLVMLQHSVDPSLRANARFMSHDSVIAALRLLLDASNRPLWQSGLSEGVPDRLLGQPIVYNQYMASAIATTNKTMLYGDFSYMKLREVGQMLLQNLIERFAETQQIGMVLGGSFDARLYRWTSNANCPVKHMAQA